MDAKEKSSSQSEHPKRGKWRRRVKNFFVALSALLCLAAMVAWGFGMAGWGFECLPFPEFRSSTAKSSAFDLQLEGYAHALAIEWCSGTMRRHFAVRYGGYFTPEPLTLDDEKRFFVSVSYEDHAETPWDHRLFVPYWLLILLFALAPALWWRRRYVERRQKKFFEQIIAEKQGRVGVPADRVSTNPPTDAGDGVPPQ